MVHADTGPFLLKMVALLPSQSSHSYTCHCRLLWVDLFYGINSKEKKTAGDVDTMNKCSASNQELQAASELGAQGGTSSPSGNHLVSCCTKSIPA
jgi:hypothetical protein